MIRTLHSQDRGDRSVSLVEITPDHPPVRSTDEGKRIVWEFICNACGSMSTMLTEAEAEAEMDTHECPTEVTP